MYIYVCVYVCVLFVYVPDTIYVYTELVFLTGLKHDWKPIFSCTELVIYEVVPVKLMTPFARNQVFLPVHWSSLERKTWYVRLLEMAYITDVSNTSRHTGPT